MWFTVLFGLCLSVANAAAWRWGGRPERLTGAIFAVAWLISFLVENRAEDRFQTVWLPILAIDVVMLIVLVALALTSTRYWLVVVAAMQLILFAAHLAKALHPQFAPLAYSTMTWTWPLFQVCLLIAGCLAQRSAAERTMR